MSKQARKHYMLSFKLNKRKKEQCRGASSFPLSEFMRMKVTQDRSVLLLIEFLCMRVMQDRSMRPLNEFLHMKVT